MANLISFTILVFFFWGRSLRFKNLKLHMRVMTAVIIADLSLIAYLVVARNALGKLEMGMPWTLKIHVPIAIFTAGMLLLTGWTGYQLSKGKPLHRRMRFLDRILVPARVLTLLTSLMVQFIK
ncbi:MAG: hypothetical protein ACXVA9_00855 [Bdellovibrionales bacterium]